MELPEKFNSVEELTMAYKNLEKEFTKRCERVSQLQKQVDSLSQSLAEKSNQVPEENVPKQISEQEKEEIIQEFLKGVVSSKSQAVLSSGGQAVVAPPRKPKTLKEANLMAKFLLKGE